MIKRYKSNILLFQLIIFTSLFPNILSQELLEIV